MPLRAVDRAVSSGPIESPKVAVPPDLVPFFALPSLLQALAFGEWCHLTVLLAAIVDALYIARALRVPRPLSRSLVAFASATETRMPGPT